MSDVVIRCENIGKKYLIDHTEGRYETFRDVLGKSLTRPWKRLWRQGNGKHGQKSCTEAFWALRDVSFEVKQGEVVGIIGHNGAGKSTLLKILSRITEPTEGFAEIRGRLGSLLEVGTGFHEELTGRENIYLYGVILGMKRVEIARKFDEIVAFAEVEQFLDTPVKRYSSGMYLRLAFAVAAHLDPEVLVVDEVLAVGDAAFQRRCLQKMEEVSQAGRTVLFVSHNLGSIRTLCQQVITLDRGRLLDQGDTNTQISQYLSRLETRAQVGLDTRTDRGGNGKVRFSSIGFTDETGQPLDQVLAGSPLQVVLGYRSECFGSKADIHLSFWSAEGHKLLHVGNRLRGQEVLRYSATGELTCRFKKLPFPPGKYHINSDLFVDDHLADHIPTAAVLHVLPGDFFGSGRVTKAWGAMFFADHDWNERSTGPTAEQTPSVKTFS